MVVEDVGLGLTCLTASSPPPLPIPSESTKTSEELYAELKKCNPSAAAQLHPKDRRRVLRALQVCQEKVDLLL